MSNQNVSRRSLLRGAALGTAALTVPLPRLAEAAAAAAAAAPTAAAPAPGDRAITKDRVHQSVCKWCFGRMSVEELAQHSQRIGLKGMDLVGTGDWPTLKKYGLICTMANSHPIDPGLNRKENHEACLAKIREGINAAADAGFPNVICFSGNRKGMSDDEGLKNCAEALKQVVGLAEEKKVTLCMELLNSKHNHKDYMCDRTPWGVELVKAVGSPRFKLLYDIYHMQIMEGDVIYSIKTYKDYIGHYHTAGVPGRNEIDETQELNYPAIMQAIADTGYQGYVGQEFIPKRDPIASLTQAARICDV